MHALPIRRRANGRKAECAFAHAQAQRDKQNVRRNGEEAGFGEGDEKEGGRPIGRIGPAQDPIVHSFEELHS